MYLVLVLLACVAACALQCSGTNTHPFSQAAVEGAKRLQLIQRELKERIDDNAERQQQLATEEQELLNFQEHLKACRARVAALQHKLVELDEQSAATQTLPLVQDVSAHAVLSKVWLVV